MAIKLDDLISSLNDSYLCRESQIRQLSEYLLESCQTLMVYGLRSTAKTSIVRTMCRRSNSFHAYINCKEFFANKMVYENILNQLNDKINCFESKQINCNSISDFIDYFKQILDNYNQKKEKKTKDMPFTQCIVVLDSIDSNNQLLNANNSELITCLTNLQEFTQNVCPITCVLISRQSIEWFTRITSSSLTAIQINFNTYSVEQLSAILCKDCPIGYNTNFYQNFINIIIKSIIQTTNDLNEIRCQCLTHFPKYVEPINSGELNPNESAKLYKRFQPILVQMIEEMPLKLIRINSESTEWSESMKYLLIASYLSSYNLVKNDKKVFVKYEGKKNERKRKMASDDKECVGPKAAPFERILHIYKSIIELNARNSDQYLKEASNRLLSQFQELISLKYIHRSVSQTRSNVLSTQTKYEISSSVTLNFIKYLSQELDLNIMAFIHC